MDCNAVHGHERLEEVQLPFAYHTKRGVRRLGKCLDTKKKKLFLKLYKKSSPKNVATRGDEGGGP